MVWRKVQIIVSSRLKGCRKVRTCYQSGYRTILDVGQQRSVVCSIRFHLIRLWKWNISSIPSYQIVEMEYFFDSDNPEEGSGTKVVLPDPLTRQMSFEVSVDGLDVGEHQFLLRAKGQDGQWSLIQSEPFVITEDITGVREVAWTAPVNIGLDANSNVVVTLTNDAGGKDYQVDVFSSSGKKLVSSLWKNGKYNHVVPMTNATEQVLIVKVSEVGGRKYVIKKLILR